MYSEAQARKKVLDFVNSSGHNPNEDEFVISDIRLSENKDYWITSANSKAYIEQGDSSRCYVGASAYMLNTETGEIEIVGNAQSPETYLKDKYDIKLANGNKYILVCSHNPKDKKAIINIHQVFNCPLKHAMHLVRDKTTWFTGIKRHLEEAKLLLETKDIMTEIQLTDTINDIPVIQNDIIWWEAMQKIIQENLNA